MGRLEGKIAIVTGGGSGMGASHCRRFVREGAKVICTDINVKGGRAVADELGEACLFVEHDVADGESWRNVCEEAERVGPVSILVNNAGVVAENTFTEVSDAEYNRVIAINQTGVFLGCRAVVPLMERAGGGSIVNISSVAGLCGFPKGVVYCTSKFAVRGLSKALAVEVAKLNIRVNSVHPGVIRTPMASAADTPGLVEPLIPMGRIGEPEELTNLVLFLASDEASYCTGAEFIADGGLSAP
ncbi:glucose 1-dehydrogenase [Sphingobium sp.]|uniref:SDR family NAD(P)-dependent oxidoreductase n=1 Tax=Sphingobium sp. TaxID=1912891 RepID=UPI0028BD922A|nr:glucose 1-dehydrogenase [Sphingobium sp.]